ncbi:MAG: TauD/TfdA family dioxygenase, partial [Betaproteobacteria bacterium]|nr:TauD/TfdA family dioxygenase [Betaproteobacteria bacterium]
MTKGIRMPNIQIQPVSYALGARVTNIDLSKPVSSSDLKMIQDAWTQHVVLIFPDQKLDPKLLIEFTKNFGDLDNYATQPFNRHPEHDEVMLLSNKPIQGKIHPGANNGQNWHTDLSYTIRPAKATMVYCIEKPSVGGDTMFANMYAVYEALSPKMREFLDGLEGINDV